jgi:predicted 3-demethylubiquinone-9 3-methyltransferase (glyoxalase superfamily)
MTTSAQTIVPHLWYDKEAKEAADFYVSTFGADSAVTNLTTLHDTPSGDCDVVSFELLGHPFMAISAGPLFTFNPSISFIVGCETAKEVDRLWNKLSAGGTTLMPLDKYPFSDRYGWLRDKYGLSWQLIFTKPEGDERPKIVPSLMFVGDVCGKAEEAIKFYVSVFKGSKQGEIFRYGKDQAPDKEGNVMFADFKLGDTWLAAMDSARDHDFGFNEAISLMVRCDTQKEIDYYWERLSAVPEAEQCGWLKDKYGVSWQVAPAEMDEMMANGTPEQIARVTQTFLPMKKLDVAKLRDAYEAI